MFHLWRSGAIAGRIKDGVTLLGGVSCSSFFITMSFPKPRYEREEFANSLFQAQILMCHMYFHDEFIHQFTNHVCLLVTFGTP